jgi:hypothetical protein
MPAPTSGELPPKTKTAVHRREGAARVLPGGLLTLDSLSRGEQIFPVRR